ncbi:peptidoglycan-associated lipoprotein Pal [Candidatus Venteria ishoeyi]|uniref:Peptidoglycan-associated lipoprotein n=1 Tax=Candidatus Venteria ishoeyi TaxID=1899563 RepID=A0A1H6FGL3_9GAMM|nr:peptidoglycan-associated lipoprotein Pal [Candidatus Venteria ishoeyi]MDM8545837.1 peptidoglycan-associated lipoprotein Pal [Candidatus Venteria ishoeyi]SEH08296.1 Peptidoglycan-associated lipoprotein precursor [Candidatus Venteria ishoeyi]
MSLKPYLFLPLLLALFACSKQQKPSTETPGGIATTIQPGGQTVGLGSEQAAEGVAIQPGMSAPLQNRVYFDFDLSHVRPDQRDALNAHARYLLAHPQARIRLEGHADERGSREYNLALGDRRAQAVQRYLMISGIDKTRMDTLSYGEEKPLASEHEEASWQRNRRVEIVY